MKSFLLGFGCGVGLGLIVAPRAGIETRDKLKQTFGRTADKLQESAQPVAAVQEAYPKVAEMTATEQESAGATLVESFHENDAREESRLIEILNSASKTKLMSVRGIGDATAVRIIENRPFTTSSAVLEQGLISDEVLHNLERELLEADEAA